MAPNPADPIAAAAKLLAILLGIELATFLAPHIVILLAGMVGATFGLMSWRQCSRLEAIGYVLAMSAVAWLFSGSAAGLLVGHFGLADNPSPLLAPVAASIGWVGHRWPALGKWALNLARTAIEKKAGGAP